MIFWKKLYFTTSLSGPPGCSYQTWMTSTHEWRSKIRSYSNWNQEIDWRSSLSQCWGPISQFFFGLTTLFGWLRLQSRLFGPGLCQWVLARQMWNAQYAWQMLGATAQLWVKRLIGKTIAKQWIWECSEYSILRQNHLRLVSSTRHRDDWRSKFPLTYCFGVYQDQRVQE